MRTEKYIVELIDALRGYILYENIATVDEQIGIDEYSYTYEKKYLFSGSLSDIYAFIQLYEKRYLKL